MRVWTLFALVALQFPCAAIASCHLAGDMSVDLAKAHADGRLQALDRPLRSTSAGPGAVLLEAREDPGIAWLEGVAFVEGEVGVTVRGRDAPGASFVGIAFHGVDEDTHEAVYLRPFHFASQDPVRRARAIQYVSHPEHTWQALRESHPGVYEAAVLGAMPVAGEWTRLRLAVRSNQLSVYIGEAVEPSLSVALLGGGGGGRVGLWVGNRSDGGFRDLCVRPAAAEQASAWPATRGMSGYGHRPSSAFGFGTH